jgi:hypothetical protein
MTYAAEPVQLVEEEPKAKAKKVVPKKKVPLILADVNQRERKAVGMQPPPPYHGPGQRGIAGAPRCQVCGRSDLLLLRREDTGKLKCLNCVGLSSAPSYSVEEQIYPQYESYDNRAFNMNRVLAQCPQPADIPLPCYPALTAPPQLAPQQYLSIAAPPVEAPLQIQYAPQAVTSVPQYALPAQQYALPAQQYALPAQQYALPAQQYALPAQQYALPAQQYALPAQYSGPQYTFGATPPAPVYAQ